MCIIEKSMPDKRYVKGCGSSCLRCWENRLMHGNPQSKKWLAEHPDKHCWLEEMPEQTKSKKISRYYIVEDGTDDFERMKTEPRRLAGKNSRRARWADRLF